MTTEDWLGIAMLVFFFVIMPLGDRWCELRLGLRKRFWRD